MICGSKGGVQSALRCEVTLISYYDRNKAAQSIISLLESPFRGTYLLHELAQESECGSMTPGSVFTSTI